MDPIEIFAVHVVYLWLWLDDIFEIHMEDAGMESKFMSLIVDSYEEETQSKQ